jgi:hypothetical protein
MGTVIYHYLKTSLYVGINLALAYIVVRLLLKHYPRILNGKVRLILLMIGTASLLVAGIGKLGWHSGITTYGGDSNSENLNDAIFLILSHVGTFCIFLDFSKTLSENKK